MLQRHDLVKVLGERPFKYEGQQNIDILNQGFRDEKLLPKTPSSSEDAATNDNDEDSKKEDGDASIPVTPIPVVWLSEEKKEFLKNYAARCKIVHYYHIIIIK